MTETEPLIAKNRAIVVTGGTAGLGDLIIRELFTIDISMDIVRLGKSHPTGRTKLPIPPGKRVHEVQIDLRNPTQCIDLGRQLSKLGLRCEVLINNAGVNRIRPFEDENLDMLSEVMQVNAFSNAQLAQSIIDQLTVNKGLILNIVSNAAHQPMSFSLAYNMSKAAQLMLTMQMARELRKTHGITVMAISPNKLSGTKMSKYIDVNAAIVNGKTVEEMKQYQLNGLASGKETDPQGLAYTIAELVTDRDRWQYLNGCNWEYGR